MTQAAQTLERIIPLDPNDASTWRNVPCPVDLAPIQRELSVVGGVNEHGFANFRIVWGQEYRTFDLGRMRIHFDEEAVPAIHTPNRFAVPEDVYARAVDWYRREHERRSAAYLSLDWKEFNRYADLAEYLEQNELSDNYKRLPNTEEDLQRLISLMPPGWMYLNGLHTFEHIGQQCFYVLQWFRAEEFGSKAAWDEVRFGRTYVPETDQVEELVDINGPYPERGQYEHVAIRVSSPRTYEDKHPVIIGQTVTREIQGYKEPTLENTVEPLRELLKIRDRLTDYEKSAQARNRRRFTEFRDRMLEGRVAFKENFQEIFRDAKPVGGGNPTNISANKSKS